MSLHYLVKLEMPIRHMLPLRCYRKKLQNLFQLNCGPQICQIWIQLITACGSIAREGVQNASLIWTHWNGAWERSGPSWIMLSLRQPFIGGVVYSSRSVMRVLYTVSCNIPHMLLSTEFKSAANSDAIVEVGLILEFLSVKTKR